ncbi:MAG: ABC transporter permease [Anaerolineales bacterium]|nr:ABC transporter permease [Anaerolineales bacterium]
MNVGLRKIWRDLWHSRARTVLVILNIAVGVAAVGLIITTTTKLNTAIERSQRAAQSASIDLTLAGVVEDETVRALAQMPEVAGATGISHIILRWKPTLEAEWQQADVYARDFEAQTFELLQLQTGAWPTGNAVAVEASQQAPYGLPALGGSIYFEVNERAKPVRVGGLVRDAGALPPPLAERAAFYVSRSLLTKLGGPPAYNELKLQMTGEYEAARAESVAERVEDRLKNIGVTVAVTQTRDPMRHAFHDIVDGVSAILTLMAVASLGLSAVLVINTLNAILSQQIQQIGVMKAIGGVPSQITRLYLFGVAVYSVVSLLMALPLGMWGGNAMADWILGLLNVPTGEFQLVPLALAAQLVAGVLMPFGAALWPIGRGAAISVREAIFARGLDTASYGRRWIDRWLGAMSGLPRSLALALRNTFRHTSRAALTELIMITAGALFSIVLSTQGSFEKSLAEVFDIVGSDVAVTFAEYQRAEKVITLTDDFPNISHAELWLQSAVAVHPPDETHAQTILISAYPLTTQFARPLITAGQDLQVGARELLLNEAFAQQNGLAVGDWLILDLGPERENAWQIVGLMFDAGPIGYGTKTAYLLSETLAAELGRPGWGQVLHVRVNGATMAEHEALEHALRDYFNGRGMTVALTEVFIRIEREAAASFGIITTLLLVMTALIAAVGGIALSGLLSINVLERRREIGVMRAVGASSFDIGLIFIGEGMLLALVSWALGTLINLLAAPAFTAMLFVVVDFPGRYYYSPEAPGLWLALVLTLALFASWLPARRATQVSIRESLAYD